MPEQFKSGEQREVSDQEVVVDLQNCRLNSGNPMELLSLQKWCGLMEQKTMQASQEEQVGFELRRARIYFSAGYLEISLEAYQDALTMAGQFHLDELSQRIDSEIQKLFR